MYEIETGIPIPPEAYRPKAERTMYQLGDLVIGASLCVPVDRRGSVYEAAKQWRTRHPGWTFFLQPSRDADKGFIRLWRLT